MDKAWDRLQINIHTIVKSITISSRVYTKYDIHIKYNNIFFIIIKTNSPENEIFTHSGYNNLSQEKTPNFLPLCTSQKKMSLFVSNFQIVINISYGCNLKERKSKFQLINYFFKSKS